MNWKQRLNLAGQRFGFLTAIRDSGETQNRKRLWVCECDCGGTSIVRSSHLKNGHTTSCGCDLSPSNNPKGYKGRGSLSHGLSHTNAYRSWDNMKSRCYNPNVREYPRYGGRGIKVCKEWVDNFAAFYDYMGEREPYYSIDRIDPDGNYEPGNVQWLSVSENSKKSWSDRR